MKYLQTTASITCLQDCKHQQSYTLVKQSNMDIGNHYRDIYSCTTEENSVSPSHHRQAQRLLAMIFTRLLKEKCFP